MAGLQDVALLIVKAIEILLERYLKQENAFLGLNLGTDSFIKRD